MSNNICGKKKSNSHEIYVKNEKKEDQEKLTNSRLKEILVKLESVIQCIKVCLITNTCRSRVRNSSRLKTINSCYKTLHSALTEVLKFWAICKVLSHK